MSTNDMANSERVRKGLHHRIQQQIDYFGGVLPERHTIAWAGFLAGVFEEGVLDYRHYSELVDMLPKISAPDPIADIFIFEPAVRAAEAKLEGVG